MTRDEARSGPTRIVYVVDNISFRGGERTFLQLVQGLARSRYELAVACSPGGVFVEQLQDLGVPVIAAEMRKRRRLDTVLALAREFRRRRPHIVHTQGRGDPFGRLSARLARVPAVVSTTAMISTRYDVEERWRRIMYRAIDSHCQPFSNATWIIPDIQYIAIISITKGRQDISTFTQDTKKFEHAFHS